jgi:dephospho-CoA kinase
MITYAYSISGRIASGKSTVSRLLAERRGWDLVSFGDFVRMTARERGLSTDRRTLQELGSTLLGELGPVGILESARAACNARSEVQVIDGIRHVDVWNAVRGAYHATALIYLESQFPQRYHRYRNRHGLAEDDFSVSDFASLDQQAIEAGIETLLPHADAIFSADLPLPTLMEEIERFIDESDARW